MVPLFIKGKILSRNGVLIRESPNYLLPHKVVYREKKRLSSPSFSNEEAFYVTQERGLCALKI